MTVYVDDRRVRLVSVAIGIALSACVRSTGTPPQIAIDVPPSVAEAGPEPRLVAAFDELELEVEEHEEGLVVQLPSVFLFEFDSHVLSSEAVERLLAVAEVLNQPMAEDRSIRVEGHTDSTGHADYNLALSHRRARAVMGQLAAGRVAADRMSIRGLGSTSPRAPNSADGSDSPEGRALNRRVEIIIEDPKDSSLAQDSGGSRE